MNKVVYKDDYASIGSKKQTPTPPLAPSFEETEAIASPEEEVVDNKEEVEINVNTDNESLEVEQESSEEKARRLGWIEKDKFRGNSDDWVSADEFIEKGEKELPVLKENFKRLDRKNQQLEKDLKVMRDSFSGMEKKAFDRAVDEIKQQQKFAVEDGDVEKFDSLEKRKEEYVKEFTEEKEKTKRSEEPHVPPEVSNWVNQNSWFNNDMELQAKAEDYHIRLSSSRPDLSLEENLAEVTRQIKKNFPQKFGNPNRGRSAAVESSPSFRNQNKGKKTYSDLPQEAQQVCDKFVKHKVLSREDYIKQYFNEK